MRRGQRSGLPAGYRYLPNASILPFGSMHTKMSTGRPRSFGRISMRASFKMYLLAKLL